MRYFLAKISHNNGRMPLPPLSLINNPARNLWIYQAAASLWMETFHWCSFCMLGLSEEQSFHCILPGRVLAHLLFKTQGSSTSSNLQASLKRQLYSCTPRPHCCLPFDHLWQDLICVQNRAHPSLVSSLCNLHLWKGILKILKTNFLGYVVRSSSAPWLNLELSTPV